MKYVWLVLAFFAIIMLAVIMFFQNLPALAHNIFYKTKRPICWDPMKDWQGTYDPSEDCWHE